MSDAEKQTVLKPISPESENKPQRCINKQIEIAACVNDVWAALTDDHELMQWLALEARVTGGAGGKIFLSWGPDCEGEADIVAWEPGKKFAWQESISFIEWTLEARGEKTLLRLTQTGFTGEADCEGEYLASTDYGWDFMLSGLRLMLEKHRGKERNVAWPRVRTTLSREEAYRRVMAANGVFAEDPKAKLVTGKSYSLKTTTNETYSGTVEFVTENRGFCLVVSELNDALFWLTLEGPDGNIEVQIWLSAFGIAEDNVNDFNTNWHIRLKNILG